MAEQAQSVPQAQTAPTTLQRYQINPGTLGMIQSILADGQKAINAAADGDFTATMLMGAAICDLQGLILQDKNITNMIMSLQGKALGFRTDKDQNGGYDPITVVACYTEAALKGLPPVGNCWNIIGGRTYTTKEGFTYLLHRQGVQYTLLAGTPENEKTTQPLPGKTLRTVEIPVTVKWGRNTEHLRFEVRLNNGMTADAVIGKAKAKALKWLYEQVQSNQFLQMEAVDNAEPIVVNTAEAIPGQAQAAPTQKPRRNVVEVWLDGALKRAGIAMNAAEVLKFAARRGYDANDANIIAQNLRAILAEMQEQQSARIEGEEAL